MPAQRRMTLGGYHDRHHGIYAPIALVVYLSSLERIEPVSAIRTAACFRAASATVFLP